MTDRQGALTPCSVAGSRGADERSALRTLPRSLQERRAGGRQVVLDAGDAAPERDGRVFEHVQAVAEARLQPRQSESRAGLIGDFCHRNPAGFHRVDGAGYAFWADRVLELDAINPQVAARIARALELWRRFTPALRDGMRAALEKVAAQVKSRDVREIVEKALA